MRRTWIGLLHVAYWLVYAILVAVMLLIVSAGRSRPNLPFFVALLASPVGALSFVPNILAFYFAYFGLFPRFAARRRFALLSAGVVLGAVVSVGLALLLTDLWSRQEFSPLRGPDLGTMAVALSVIAVIHSAMALVLRGFVDWFAAVQAREELARRNHEMELELLRAKFDPHFLFNSLNNIDVLIGKDPAKASAYLNKLAGLFRFALYESRAPTIPLSQEIGYLTQYVALEQLRSANPRSVSIRATGATDGLVIAPMTLVPYVENAFKHTPSRVEDDAIGIEIRVEGGTLFFTCRNKTGARGPAVGGLGNDLIRRRLELLYPSRHTVTTLCSGGVYAVTLELNCA